MAVVWTLLTSYVLQTQIWQERVNEKKILTIHEKYYETLMAMIRSVQMGEHQSQNGWALI